MANKEGVMLTRKGLQLVAKLSANAGDLQILAVKVGTGILPEGTDILPMTDIISYKMDGIIADCWYNPNGEDGYVVMQLDNTEVESGFVMTEIGLYATDPDLGEILYAYVDMSDDPNYIMPATYGSAGESDNMPMGPIRHKMVQMKLHILVGGAKSLSAVINPAAQITREVFDREINSIVTPEWDDSGEVEGIESFTDFMEKFVKGTSIYQMFANLKAGLKFILHAGHLVNNGMCETPGEFALDAAYGKTLQDQITQVYSDIQDLQNGLSALDTRVTNAINGGDLAAPFEMNFLITPYSNSITNVENSVTLDANTANKLQYTAYATYNNETGDYDAKVTRTYNTAVKIPDNKCILTFSGSCLVRSGYGEHIDNNLKVEVLNSAGSKLMETSAINSTANTTVQLSLASLKGQTVKLRVSMMSDGYPWRPRGFVISKLSISNKA